MGRLDHPWTRILGAFAGAPRPSNPGLLHPSCFDDGDLQVLYGYEHWTSVPQRLVEREYAAVFFLSPAGYRHFLPAYLLFCLNHAGNGAAAIEATLMSLSSESDRHFVPSRFGELSGVECAAIVAVLEALADREDVERLVTEWQERAAETGGEVWRG